jgi:hypothetical protein
MKKILNFLILILVFGGIFYTWFLVKRYTHEREVLKQVINRLEADSSAAHILVTKVEFNAKLNKNLTTIKFIEVGHKNRGLAHYYTFSGNIIQFQSLVIRFNDKLVAGGDKLKGKSAYIFWKVFMLDGQNTQEYEINRANTVPHGYKIDEDEDPFEARLWGKFWEYALNEKAAQSEGIKNAQIEAPGTIFVPGTLYTIKIEHDGGLRIDSAKIPDILRGEKLP